jgi:hypothetical protein
MLCYLRVQAHVVSHDYAQLMFQSGGFTFAPGHASSDLPLPYQTPEAVAELVNLDPLQAMPDD